MCIGVVIVSQGHHSRRDTNSCACGHVQVNVSAVSVYLHTQPKLACMCEISLKIAILSSMDYWIE